MLTSRCHLMSCPLHLMPVSQVFIARREKRLLRETQLTEIVLRLYRSSETLLQLTGSKLKRHGE